MRRLLPLLAATSAVMLSACALGPQRATVDGVNFTEMTVDQTNSVQRCPWRACVLAEPGTYANIIRAWVAEAFASAVVSTDMDGGKNCDIGFQYKSLGWADNSDVISAYTNEKLFHLDANAHNGARLACSLLLPNQPLGAALEKQRAQARGLTAPPPVAAPEAAPAPVAAAPRFSSDVERPRYRLDEREHDFAIVVGIETYSDLPKAQYAERDAEAFAAHAKALGVPQRNLVLLTGSKAGRAAIEKYVEHWLPRLVAPDSRVYFYFSGHGAPDIATGQAYLVPWDGDPNFLDSTAYPIKRLYEKLGALKAKQVLVAMDSCFSGAGGRSVMASGARPLMTKIDAGAVSGSVTALMASGAEEISGSLDDQGHGAFTYFLLKGLNGDAQDLSAAGLIKYLTPRVQDEARRLNRDQTPQLLGDGDVKLR